MTYRFDFTTDQVNALLGSLHAYASEQEVRAQQDSRAGWALQADEHRANAHRAHDLVVSIRDQWNHQVA